MLVGCIEQCIEWACYVCHAKCLLLTIMMHFNLSIDLFTLICLANQRWRYRSATCKTHCNWTDRVERVFVCLLFNIIAKYCARIAGNLLLYLYTYFVFHISYGMYVCTMQAFLIIINIATLFSVLSYVCTN